MNSKHKKQNKTKPKNTRNKLLKTLKAAREKQICHIHRNIDTDGCKFLTRRKASEKTAEQYCESTKWKNVTLEFYIE